MKKEKSCGSIIYRYKDGKRQFLLIHQLQGNFIGFPKGHQEADESDIKTAIRETKEETHLHIFVFDQIKTEINYIINHQIDKSVVFFLATALSDDILKQDDEVKDIMWVDENKVEKTLTHDNTKIAFFEIIKQFRKTIEYQMDIKLISYLYETILPKYKSFDQAHQLDHIHEVLKTSIDISNNLKDIKLDLVYVIAFYHDIGNMYGRDEHHITGAKYLEDDLMIQSFFNKDEIKIMKEAIEDHRASHDEEPRSIYGKIIAEADRIIIPEHIIKRTVQFGLSHYPNITQEEHIQRSMDHINVKYGPQGYLKLWLDSKKNVEGLKELRTLLEEPEQVKKIIVKYYHKFKKK